MRFGKIIKVIQYKIIKISLKNKANPYNMEYLRFTSKYLIGTVNPNSKISGSAFEV